MRLWNVFRWTPWSHIQCLFTYVGALVSFHSNGPIGMTASLYSIVPRANTCTPWGECCIILYVQMIWVFPECFQRTTSMFIGQLGHWVSQQSNNTKVSLKKPAQPSNEGLKDRPFPREVVEYLMCRAHSVCAVHELPHRLCRLLALPFPGAADVFLPFLLKNAWHFMENSSMKT